MAVGEIAGGTGCSPSPLTSGLLAMMREPDLPMWIELVREDQTEKFVGLMNDLRRKFSITGDGKRITCCYAYMGVEPALAWATACRDLMYPVMKRSIESFGERWRCIRSSIGPGAFHYVSLGPGDGQKDGVIIEDLRSTHPHLCYVPVDASTEMLRLAVRDLIFRLKLPKENVLSLSWDFAARDNLVALRSLLDKLFGDGPVLFSLLGNTLANFDDDADLLRLLAAELLRPQDRLLLEVATTPALTEELAVEYESSPTFGEFVTSALRRYTDLRVDKDSVEYRGSVEDNRALMIKMVYRNHTGADIPIKLPNRADFSFVADDTIRLALTRKYSTPGIAAMLAGSGLATSADSQSELTGPNKGPRFGLELLMLAPARDARPAATPAATLADRVWSR